MELLNYSAEPEGRLRSWLPYDLQPEKVVFFPDACPGKSPLPTGSTVLTRQPDWRRFAVSDCGCGMRLLRSELGVEALTSGRWDAVARLLQDNKGRLGDLGGGNHFLDALESYDENRLYFLVHTGSRDESGLVDNLIDKPDEFDKEFLRIVQWARNNRSAIQESLEKVFGLLEPVLDLPHNTCEQRNDGCVIIRKGAVSVKEGSLNIIPSHMAGDVSLVRATARIDDALCSLSHGTGRTMPRGSSKELAIDYDFEELKRRVLMPSFLEISSLRSEGPYAYRDLDDCLNLLGTLVKEEKRFSVIGYMGHL